MDHLQDLMSKRYKILLELKIQKEKELNNAPIGSLHIINSSNRKPQFYHRKPNDKTSGTYIKAKDMYLAKELAQKNYNQKLIQSIDKELVAIDSYMDLLPQVFFEKVYNNLSDERKKLVKPLYESDDEFIKNWESVKYDRLKIEDTGFFTDKNEMVRSKSEIIIANTLYRLGIPYRYEYPLRFMDGRIIYPDFTLLDVKQRKEVIFEHFGMMDDPIYAEKTMKKISNYESNGYYMGNNFLCTFESKNVPLNNNLLIKKLKHYINS